MPRKDKEEIEEEAQEKALSQTQAPGIIEVQIDLKLLNDKLNYLISKVEEISLPKK